MAISSSPIQQAAITGGAPNNFTTITLTQTPQLNSLLVFFSTISDTTNGPITGITQTGVTWTKAISSGSTKYSEVWYGYVNSGSASTTGTAALTGTPSLNSRCHISEWGGINLTPAGLGPFASNTGTSATPTSATVTPATTRPALILAYTGRVSTGAFSSGPTNSFTAMTTPSTAVLQGAYFVATAPSGSYSTSWTFAASTAWESETVVFYGLPGPIKMSQYRMDLGNVPIRAASTMLYNTPSAGAVSGVTFTVTSAETQALGDAVQMNSSGNAHLAKADVIADASGMFLAAAAVTGSASNTYMADGVIRFSSSQGWTAGNLIYLSTTGTTGNTLTTTQPSSANNVIQVLGVALANDTFYFSPSLVQVEHS